ncbi:hypothetical protein BJX62DRAFT_221217 [Aspergillus germanicus]
MPCYFSNTRIFILEWLPPIDHVPSALSRVYRTPLVQSASWRDQYASWLLCLLVMFVSRNCVSNSFPGASDKFGRG